MKTLSKHIYEKLKINKDFKQPLLCGSDPLNDSGRCICLAIPSKNNSAANRMEISSLDSQARNKTLQYKKLTRGDVKIEIDCGYYVTKEVTQRTDGDFYTLYKDNIMRSSWCYFILFENDALALLNELLEDPNKKFDTSIFSSSNDNIQVGKLNCYNGGKMFEQYEIQQYIREFKHSEIQQYIRELKHSLK